VKQKSLIPKIEIGDKIKSEIHLDEYGRTAASNLFRELEYHIQRKIEQDLFRGSIRQKLAQ